MKRDLLEYFSAIDRLMLTDIPAGGLSVELQALLNETEARVDEYCRSRWYRPRANRRLRAAWNDFYETITNAKIERPYRGYEFSTCSKPSDFGLDVKIKALYRALH